MVQLTGGLYGLTVVITGAVFSIAAALVQQPYKHDRRLNSYYLEVTILTDLCGGFETMHENSSHTRAFLHTVHISRKCNSHLCMYAHHAQFAYPIKMQFTLVHVCTPCTICTSHENAIHTSAFMHAISR